jgi:hypothetical protein
MADGNLVQRSGIELGVLVTPEVARTWLAMRSTQRPLNARNVARLAKEMTAGRWRESNDCICFSTKGDLINGQHRASAVIASGASVRMDVKRGVPEDSFEVMDVARRRKGGDIVAILGGTHAILKAAIISAVVAYEDGRTVINSSWVRLSNTDMAREFEARDGERLHAATAMARGFPTTLGLQPSVVGAVHYIASGIDLSAADLFMSTLKHGQVNGKFNQAAVDLRESLLRRPKGRRDAVENMAVLIKAWNRRDDGKRCRRPAVYVRSTGTQRESMPRAV